MNTLTIVHVLHFAAISLRRDNVKAYYRKSMALKSKREYLPALKVAIEGQTRVEQSERANEEYVSLLFCYYAIVIVINSND